MPGLPRYAPILIGKERPRRKQIELANRRQSWYAPLCIPWRGRSRQGFAVHGPGCWAWDTTSQQPNLPFAGGRLCLLRPGPGPADPAGVAGERRTRAAGYVCAHHDRRCDPTMIRVQWQEKTNYAEDVVEVYAPPCPITETTRFAGEDYPAGALPACGHHALGRGRR